MPRSDNLYSAVDEEESETESFSDDLSPSDGYFRGSSDRASPQTQAMVPDPTLDYPVEGKTLMAGRNTEALIEMNSRAIVSPPIARPADPSVPYASPPTIPATSSSSSSSPSPHNAAYPSRSPSFPSPERHIAFPSSPPASLSIDGPPPAYSASPTSTSPTTQARSTTATYGTFSSNPPERGLPTHREPQSMGGPVEALGERTPLSPHPLKTRSRRRRVLKKIFRLALIFSVVVTVLSLLMRHHDKFSTDDPQSPDLPSDPMRSRCPITAASHEASYDFPLQSGLTVIQTFDKDRGYFNRWSHVSTAGEIRLRKLPKDLENGNQGVIKVSYNVSHPDLAVSQIWNPELGLFEFKTPQFANVDTSRLHCISVEITVWVPEDATLPHLNFDAITLSLRVAPDTKVSVSETSDMTTVSGGVYFPNPDSSSTPSVRTAISRRVRIQKDSISTHGQVYPFSCRNINIGTVSGNIHGTYPLFDSLNISSVSGHIHVDVSPQAAAPHGLSDLADFAIQTASGNILANLPLPGPQNPSFKIIPRQYVTHVRSASGSIKGAYYLGVSSKFESSSGGINFTILPVIAKDSGVGAPLSVLSTEVLSGKTAVLVLDPVVIARTLSSPDKHHTTPDHEIFQPIGDNDPYRILPPHLDPRRSSSTQVQHSPATRAQFQPLNINANHGATSGDIQLHYPPSWEGIVTAKSVSSDILIRGKGVEIIKEKDGWGSKEVVARKGDVEEGDRSTVRLGSVSGNLEFVVGS